MSPRVGSVFRFAAPLKAAVQRFAFASLVILCFVLMLLGKAEIVVVERARTLVTDALAPVFGVLARPVSAIEEFGSDVRSFLHRRDEIAQLRDEVGRLRIQQEAMRRVEGENAMLRSLLNYTPQGGARGITGRVIADSGGAFLRNVLLAVGSDNGVAKGQAAVTGEGLVGRVSEVGSRTARVLLITDLNSRIPVVLAGSRDRAVLAGDNTSQPRLLYLGQDAHVSVGDRVVTSGHGGTLPPGLPIGVVASAGERGVLVRPFVDWGRMEFVRILDYDLGGVVLPTPPPPAQNGPRVKRP